MENTPELKALIQKNAHLFWYSKVSEKENLPLPVVPEFFIIPMIPVISSK